MSSNYAAVNRQIRHRTRGGRRFQILYDSVCCGVDLNHRPLGYERKDSLNCIQQQPTNPSKMLEKRSLRSAHVGCFRPTFTDRRRTNVRNTNLRVGMLSIVRGRGQWPVDVQARLLEHAPCLSPRPQVLRPGSRPKCSGSCFAKPIQE